MRQLFLTAVCLLPVFCCAEEHKINSKEILAGVKDMAVAVYDTDEHEYRDYESLISQRLRSAGIKINPDSRNKLVATLSVIQLQDAQQQSYAVDLDFKIETTMLDATGKSVNFQPTVWGVGPGLGWGGLLKFQTLFRSTMTDEVDLFISVWRSANR